MKELSSFRNLGIISIILLSNIYAHALNAKENYYANSYTVQADSIALDSTGMSNLNSYEFSKKFGRGWNLGNSLEAIGGETAWGNPKTTQRLIDSIKAAGFNSIRIPVAWSRFSDAPTYTIDTNWLARVEEVVNYALNDSMYIIMNEHWDGGWLQPTYAEQEANNERLAAMWQQIAVHFRDYDDHLIFAGTNEVLFDDNYGAPSVEYYTVQNGFNQVFVNTVRSTGGRNVYRYLAVQGFNTNIDYTVSYFSMRCCRKKVVS
jgi:endoglucanase